jgi:acetyl esterase/lipase
MHMMPWLEMGWQAVNVEYRLARVAPAPAAVEDCLCALRWIVAHAAQYRIDPARLVVAGDSAGGHLALTTGMIPASAGLDRPCAPASSAEPMPKVAAIFDWYGITDVVDILDGKNKLGSAVEWLGKAADREGFGAPRLAVDLCTLRPAADLHRPRRFRSDRPLQPFCPAHDALKKAQVPTQFITVPGGVHGQFPPAERLRIYTAIREFLSKNGLPAYNQ